MVAILDRAPGLTPTWQPAWPRTAFGEVSRSTRPESKRKRGKAGCVPVESSAISLEPLARFKNSVRFRCDRSRLTEYAACGQGTALLFEPAHALRGIGFALVHRRCHS